MLALPVAAQADKVVDPGADLWCLHIATPEVFRRWWYNQHMFSGEHACRCGTIVPLWPNCAVLAQFRSTQCTGNCDMPCPCGAAGTVQAKKEELWELSKREGELADATTDVHYAEHVARAPPPCATPLLFSPIARRSQCCTVTVRPFSCCCRIMGLAFFIYEKMRAAIPGGIILLLEQLCVAQLTPGSTKCI